MSHKYLEFRRRYDQIDSEKLSLAKRESSLNDDLLKWAIGHLTREKREQIIQACIEKSLPKWHIDELQLSSAKWEESREHITKEQIELFCHTEIHHLDYVEATKTKSERFYNWFSKGEDRK
jgi:hypothetical protein